MKQYEKVRVTFSGRGIITIYDEDRRVFATQELASLRQVSVWVYIPVVFNRGYGIQFRIEGVIKVDSIEYTWTLKEAQ